MKAIEPGHFYVMDRLDKVPGDPTGSTIQFVQRGPRHEPKPGVTNQEVLRVLIDRVQFLDGEVPWAGNEQILYHLRMALVLHEARALIRHVEKGYIKPETLPLGPDGHFIIQGDSHHEA